MEKLMSLGYVSGSQPAPRQSNVIVYNKDLAFGGLNLYISGHAPEAFLIDMKGKEIHRWAYDFGRVWPDWYIPQEGLSRTKYWRRVHLFENGDLCAIYEGFGLIKIDKNSELLWSYPNESHHDMFVDDQGQIYVLTKRNKIIQRIHAEKPVIDNFITVLSPKGEPIKRISILEAFEKSPYSPLLDRMPESGDILHTNTIEIFDGKLAYKSPLFEKGNVLISILQLDAIAIVDMELERIVWATTGMWRKQHHPTLLANGNMLLFDNNRDKGMSKVIEFNPFTQEIVWAYKGHASNGFYSAVCGSNQRLPNGNTLITESDGGRAFEVTKDNVIVWEFLNPQRAGNGNELIATLIDMIRLPFDFPLDWLGISG
jgi:hypothetical protein